jgi:hypothetical protein
MESFYAALDPKLPPSLLTAEGTGPTPSASNPQKNNTPTSSSGAINAPEADSRRDAGGMEFVYWLRTIGLSRATGYRYRRDGKIVTVNIEGHLFVLSSEIERFWVRAAAGEFAKKPRGAVRMNAQSA